MQGLLGKVLRMIATIYMIGACFVFGVNVLLESTEDDELGVTGKLLTFVAVSVTWPIGLIALAILEYREARDDVLR